MWVTAIQLLSEWVKSSVALGKLGRQYGGDGWWWRDVHGLRMCFRVSENVWSELSGGAEKWSKAKMVSKLVSASAHYQKAVVRLKACILELRCLHEIHYQERSAGLTDQVAGFRHEMCTLCYTYSDPSSSLHHSLKAATDSITEKGNRPGLG